jgi:integrase
VVAPPKRATTFLRAFALLDNPLYDVGMKYRYSAHSMRATFVTTALENVCPLEDVQRAAGHAEPGTTKLYDRRGYNSEKSARFFFPVLNLKQRGSSL